MIIVIVVLCGLISFQCTSSPQKPIDVLVNPIDPKSPVFIKPKTIIRNAPRTGDVLTVPQTTITVEGNIDVVAFSYKLDANEWSPWNAATAIVLTDLDEGKHHWVIRSLHRDSITIEENPPSIDFSVNAVTGPALMFSSRKKAVLIGTNFNYYIVAEEVQKLYGAKVVFSYDNSAVKINAITSGTIANTSIQLLELQYANKARVEMFFTGNTPINGITGSDTIVVINCSPLKIGESAFTFVADSVQFRNSSNVSIAIKQIVNGKVVVK